MDRPYVFGRVYAVMNLAGAIFSGWLGVSMFETGYPVPAAMAGVSVVLGILIGIGLWQRRRYGWLLLNISLLLGIGAAVYGWFVPGQFPPLYHAAGNVVSFGFFLIVFVYFYKRRNEFS